MSPDPTNDAPPTLGFSATGEVVPYAAAAVPPLPAHPFPKAEERGDGLSATTSAAGQREAIAARLRANEAAAARESRLAGNELEQGPQHEKMVPWATPKLQARAELGGENPAFHEAMATAYKTNLTGDELQEEVEKRDEPIEKGEPFFSTFV